jgi:heat shock factor-binding protein 1
MKVSLGLFIPEIQSAQDLTNFVKNLLDQMNDRFKNMTDSIVTRIDEMSERIDDLEKTVCKLVEESNINDPINNISEKQNKIMSNKNDLDS